MLRSVIKQLEINISKWYIEIRNCALKVNFDIENMIFSIIPNAKVGFLPCKYAKQLQTEYRN